MAYKKTSSNIINAIETRIGLNTSKGNFAPITLILTETELKELMVLERLKTVTRNRLTETLRAAGYTVTDEGDRFVLFVDVAARTTQFSSLEDLIESIE